MCSYKRYETIPKRCKKTQCITPGESNSATPKDEGKTKQHPTIKRDVPKVKVKQNNIHPLKVMYQR